MSRNDLPAAYPNTTQNDVLVRISRTATNTDVEIWERENLAYRRSELIKIETSLHREVITHAARSEMAFQDEMKQAAGDSDAKWWIATDYAALLHSHNRDDLLRSL